MKRNFFAGLFILLPFALTLFIVFFIINLLTVPFQDIVERILDYYDILDKPFLFFSGEQVMLIFSKIFVLITLFGIVIFIGFLARLVLLTPIIRLGEVLINRIPMVNVIYRSIKEIINNIFNNKTKTYSQVALVPFPNSKAYSIGLISQEKPSADNTVNVFIPTTPNPTIGYMLILKASDVVFIDMKIEEALKSVVSCGIIFPEFKIKK